MGSFSSKDLTPMTPNDYASEWGQSSNDHKAHSDYTWIASQLDKPSLVLEIGCGNGNGSEEVLRLGAKLVCVEINQYLIEKALVNLDLAGYKTSVITLEQIQNIDLSSDIDCFIVHCSIFEQELNSLAKKLQFDYILFSFFGSAPIHAAEELGQPLDNLDSSYARHYREKATVRAHELKSMSSLNCKLCVVDRLQQPPGHSKYDIRNVYAEDLSSRLSISKDQLTIRTKVNTAMSKPTSSSMQYINDGSLGRKPGIPLIAIALI
jgi:SAM-dependent methyltransferase